MATVNAELHVSGSDLDELGHAVRTLHEEHRAFEDGENVDPDDFFSSLESLVSQAEQVLEWAARVRSDAARNGFAP